jgi:protein-S-isoprenylcysteine O-methyltransferase Ste14
MKRVGAWLFKYRSYTAVPLFAVMACVFWNEYEADAVIWSVGTVLVLCGAAFRFWAVRHIGRSARTRSAKAKRLVTTGPYAMTRNPLYFGNMLIGLGACVLSELLWIIPIFVALFSFQYVCIIAWEQDLLRQRFGQEYEQYAKRVPAFFPRLGNLTTLGKPPVSVLEALRRERDSLIGVAVMFLVFLAKELVDGTLVRPGG